MRPGKWEGLLSTWWLSAGWERVRQDTFPMWAYTAASGERFEIPNGFVSNLGSIPFFLWPILPRDGWKGPYILHDYLYAHIIWCLSRWEADYTLSEAIYTYTLEHTPENRYLKAIYLLWAGSRRFLVFRGLRLFGWFAWWRNGRAKHKAIVRTMRAMRK